MQRTGLQLVLEVADHSECTTEVQGLVTALAARCVQGDWDIARAAERLHLANELVAGHALSSDENVRL